MTRTVTVEYEGITLEVDYDYSPAEGDGWNDPHYEATIDMESIKHRGEDIGILLSPSAEKDIEALVWAAHSGGEEEAAVFRAEARAEALADRRWEATA